MSITLAHIWRHPIKSHGREQLTSVELTAGQAMPFDRVWAISHQLSKFNPNTPEWVSCGNFIRGAKINATTAIACSYDEITNIITLSHPEMTTLSACPDSNEGAQAIIDFSNQLCTGGDWAPTAIHKLPNRGFTDSDFPSISILNLASLRDLSNRGGHEFSMERWRGNLWIEGAQAWDECSWIGKRIEIGGAILEIKEPIGRCSMTTNDPSTGRKDFDTLKLLRDEFGHQNFGVYAQVVQGGRINIGEEAKL